MIDLYRIPDTDSRSCTLPVSHQIKLTNTAADLDAIAATPELRQEQHCMYPVSIFLHRSRSQICFCDEMLPSPMYTTTLYLVAVRD